MCCVVSAVPITRGHLTTGSHSGSLRDGTASTNDFPVLGLRLHIHFPHNLRKHLVNIHPILGARLYEGTAPYLRQSHPLHGGHLPLALEVDLVADQQDGHPLGPLHPHNLVTHRLDVLEGLVVGEAVDDDEALPVLDVEVAHGGELLRSGSVENLQNARRRVYFDLLQENIRLCTKYRNV